MLFWFFVNYVIADCSVVLLLAFTSSSTWNCSFLFVESSDYRRDHFIVKDCWLLFPQKKKTERGTILSYGELNPCGTTCGASLLNENKLQSWLHGSLVKQKIKDLLFYMSVFAYLSSCKQLNHTRCLLNGSLTYTCM